MSTEDKEKDNLKNTGKDHSQSTNKDISLDNNKSTNKESDNTDSKKKVKDINEYEPVRKGSTRRVADASAEKSCANDSMPTWLIWILSPRLNSSSGTTNGRSSSLYWLSPL